MGSKFKGSTGSKSSGSSGGSKRSSSKPAGSSKMPKSGVKPSRSAPIPKSPRPTSSFSNAGRRGCFGCAIPTLLLFGALAFAGVRLIQR